MNCRILERAQGIGEGRQCQYGKRRRSQLNSNMKSRSLTKTLKDKIIINSQKSLKSCYIIMTFFGKITNQIQVETKSCRFIYLEFSKTLGSALRDIHRNETGIPGLDSSNI